jgi:nicotinate-nucleotide adenylyltransferase
MSARRIGLLGGTFDPIHSGHLDLATAAHAVLGLTELLVIPANVPPHRPMPFTSSFHRFAMVAAAVAGRPGWQASDLELRHETPSYTVTTLRRFHDGGYAASELFFLIGADAFAEIATWRDYPGLLDYAHFAVVSRPRFAVAELPARLLALADRMVPVARAQEVPAGPSIILIERQTADVSSTAIRTTLARGESIAGMVDARVQQHIEQHGLYGSSTPDRRDARASADPAAGRLHGQD